ncbi:MAG: HAD family hydrolase [Candidatus Aureabacteria bacterium]|nr:HAD family hydrolase [Candidatus Auribacterota bacterium]
MPFTTGKIKALCFDFGNTLIEFGPKQVARQYSVLERTLTELFGSCDAARLKIIRDRQIAAPLNNSCRESTLESLCSELIHEIYGVTPEKSHVDTLVQTRYESFVNVVKLPDGVLSLLNKLSGRYCFGFLSNYPCGRSIRDSLKKIGLLNVFKTIVVSGDVGYVKPHARPFETMLSQLDFSPSECVYIGDNWVADVQGSKKMGMNSIFTTQYVPYEIFKPAKGDFSPDARINHLDELERLMLP